MRSSKTIHTVSCHAEGEVGDVIVGGVAAPPGDSIWAQSRWLERDGELRGFMLNEPRGGVFRHVNLLVPPKDPAADVGWIIMEPEHNPPMSGSNSMCVATVVLETGIVPMVEPETRLTIEAPGGLVHVRARCSNGRVEQVTVRNVPSFVDQRQAALEVEGLGTLTVDTAYGGDSFVLVPADQLGFAIEPDEAIDIAKMGMRITRAANEQLGFTHPENPDWAHVSFCQVMGPLQRLGDAITGRNAVVIEPGKLDRSPCGTGCSARMALLTATGELQPEQEFVGESIIGSRFSCRVADVLDNGGLQTIVPELSGRAWITGTHQHHLDPDDPFPEGYRISDTWPVRNTAPSRES